MQIFGTHDDATRAQLAKVAERARKVALMADGHVGYVMPIGGVAAYDNAVSVVGVGFDIACGNAAIRTDLTVADLGDTGEQVNRRLISLADEIADTLSFGVGRKNRADDAPVDDPLFEDPAWSAVPPKHRQALQVKARQQLGTVGTHRDRRKSTGVRDAPMRFVGIGSVFVRQRRDDGVEHRRAGEGGAHGGLLRS